MPAYKAPLHDIRFLMNEVLDYPAHYQTLSNGDIADADTIDMILEGAADFCENILSPLNQTGDAEGCHFENGEVKTPAWQIPMLKGLLKLDKAHLLAKGKLVEQLIKNNLQWVPFTQLANITGLPAMSVPLYWNKNNLPLGSQFIAPFGREDLLLQLAAQLEQAQPWNPKYSSIQL